MQALRNAKLTGARTVGHDPMNRDKNRFRNVVPYDSNRVVLSAVNDYVNASHIRFMVGDEQARYIASQVSDSGSRLFGRRRFRLRARRCAVL